ncbi:MAG: hypothetical protein ACOCZX_04910 [Candidatus Bipolaricaulota bacterium]
MSQQPDLILLAAEISALVGELEQCLQAFNRGESDLALERLDEVQQKVDEWIDEIEKAHEDNSSPRLAKNLREAKNNLAWVKEMECS